MSTAIVHFLPVEHMALMYNRDSTAAAETMGELFRQGVYTTTALATVPSDISGVDIADEVFDLTNNPSRQGERLRMNSRKRSVSVGDIIETDTGMLYLCCSFGWKKLV